MPSMAILARSRPLFGSHYFKSITTFSYLSQDLQLADEQPPPPSPQTTTTPLPPDPASGSPPYANAPPVPGTQITTTTPLPRNPASGSPLYNENWRNPYANAPSALIPVHGPGTGLFNQIPMSKSQDMESLMNTFADWMTSQQWVEMKQLFEYWIRSLDNNGKPNKPDVNLYNHYLRANVMIGTSSTELLDLIAQMEDYKITPNTASFKLVLKAIYQSKETNAAVNLLERMLEIGKEHKECLPDDESYDIVINMLFYKDRIDSALKYIDLSLKSGYMLSMKAFTECVRSCINQERLDILVSIIERCKKMDQNKALCPPWNMCNYIADIAMEKDNNELAYHALEFMAKWIIRGENTRPILLLSVDEGLIVSALGTAARTYSTKLLDNSWELLKRSLRNQKSPNPESYLAKIYTHTSLGNLQKAFGALHEFETFYGDSVEKLSDEIFSPFTSLYPLVVACSKIGFETLDSVYYQLENLSIGERPYKSITALNCVILGCSNIWDENRAYQTFLAIDTTFGLTPNIHSYNALISIFAKLSKVDEALKLLERLIQLGLKPNAKTYSLLVDAHLIKRDIKAALSVINNMVREGYNPSKEMLKKVRRRCIREMDIESNKRVESLAKLFQYKMGTETRRNMLFNLQYYFSPPPSNNGESSTFDQPASVNVQ